MFEISVITDEVGQDLREAAGFIRGRMRLGAVELRTLGDKNLVYLDGEELRGVKGILNDHGLKVCCIASPALKCSLRGDGGPAGDVWNVRENDYESHLALLERSMEAALFLGCRLVRCFSFWREKELNESAWEEIAEAFQRPLKMAEKKGITLCIENEHTCNAGTGGELGKLLDMIPSQGLKALWDPANARWGGEIPYPDGYEKIKGRIAHIHIKDMKRSYGRWRAAPAGEGVVDYRGQFKALAADGYRGFISLETHFTPRGGTRADGTVRSLKGLRRILKELGISSV